MSKKYIGDVAIGEQFKIISQSSTVYTKISPIKNKYGNIRDVTMEYDETLTFISSKDFEELNILVYPLDLK